MQDFYIVKEHVVTSTGEVKTEMKQETCILTNIDIMYCKSQSEYLTQRSSGAFLRFFLLKHLLLNGAS